MNIIDALFMGRIRPLEYSYGENVCDLPVSEEYKRLSKRYGELYDEITAELSKEDVKKLAELSDVQSQITYECDRAAFYKWFVLGARITAEVFGD